MGLLLLIGAVSFWWFRAPQPTGSFSTPPAPTVAPTQVAPLTVPTEEFFLVDGDPYVPDETCALCHEEIAATYSASVGMARAFAAPQNALPVERFDQFPFFHEPSGMYYALERRGDELWFHQYQQDGAGQPINAWDVQVEWVLGSGHKSRSYLYRTPNGELYQLPISWYSDDSKWAMSPGYDKANHLGIQRRVSRECMFCHNAYPPAADNEDAQNAPQFFPEHLPEGIGCQRCHGPGADHVESAVAQESETSIRGQIVNPANLAARERDDVCNQCHLLPAVGVAGVRRFDRMEYSFRPGQRLSDYLIHVDIDEDDRPSTERFEINHHAYRLRQSVSFQESDGKLTCITCHNPHDRSQTPAELTVHYRQICLECHTAHPERPTTPGYDGIADDDCVGCHMPQRRTQDVVQVVMTDHKIQIPPEADLLAPLAERHDVDGTDIFLYDPDHGLPPPQANMYLAAAVLRAVANTEAQTELARLLASEGTFELPPVYALVRSYLQKREYGQAEAILAQLMAAAPDEALAQEWAGLVLVAQARYSEAIPLLERLTAEHPDWADSVYHLGLAYRATDRPEEALVALEQALALRPTQPSAWLHKGHALVSLGQAADAVEAYGMALTVSNNYTKAYTAIVKTLEQLGRTDEAERYRQQGIRFGSTPGPEEDILDVNP